MWGSADTYQTLVNDAEHVHVMQDDVVWVAGAEGDVGDGCDPVKPRAVKALFRQAATPLGVLLLLQGVLKDLRPEKKGGRKINPPFSPPPPQAFADASALSPLSR